MNCLEFRRAYTSDPGQQDADVLSHGRTCPDCAAFVERMTAFEAGLREAVAVDVPEDLDSRIALRRSLEAGESPVDEGLSDDRFELLLEQAIRVEVPENLDSRIVLRRSIHQHKAARSRWTYGLAMAASLLLVVGVVTRIGPGHSLDPLSAELVAHVSHDPHGLVATSPVRTVALNDVLGGIGAVLPADERYTVTYASPCVMANERGAHLVLAGDDGPITVMLVPHQSPPEHSGILKSGPYSGIVVATQRGSMAVFAPREETALRMAHRLNQKLTWKF